MTRKASRKQPGRMRKRPQPQPVHIKDLTPDPENRRQHNPRNIGMIVDALHKVGAARSIVLDEDDVILAGNGVIEAAAEAGITKVRLIESDGDEIIAVKRRGLTAEQKRALAMYDNRAGELAEWNYEQLGKDADAGLDLTPWFFEQELTKMLGLGGREAGPGVLIAKFGVPPFSVLDARQGYWQERKRAWLALGIKSELGRGDTGVNTPHDGKAAADGLITLRQRQKQSRANATPGGSKMPAANYSKTKARGDGRGRPVTA